MFCKKKENIAAFGPCETSKEVLSLPVILFSNFVLAAGDNLGWKYLVHLQERGTAHHHSSSGGT